MTRPIDDPTPAGVRPLLEQAIGTLAPTLPLLTDLGARFRDAGHELALVGGPVRDAFLQRTPPDLDFATSAPPDETEAIMRSWGSATWDMGREFGTIGAVRRDPGGETTVEVTTYRADAYDALTEAWRALRREQPGGRGRSDLPEHGPPPSSTHGTMPQCPLCDSGRRRCRGFAKPFHRGRARVRGP